LAVPGIIYASDLFLPLCLGGPRYIGVMAQDLMELRPDAVTLVETGYYKEDYARIDVAMREEALAMAVG
jgi:hypothetical protein